MTLRLRKNITTNTTSILLAETVKSVIEGLIREYRQIPVEHRSAARFDLSCGDEYFEAQIEWDRMESDREMHGRLLGAAANARISKTQRREQFIKLKEEFKDEYL